MRTTASILLGTLAFLLGWETWTLYNKRKNDTISNVFWAASDATPLVALFWGLLTGHFFWPRHKETPSRTQ